MNGCLGHVYMKKAHEWCQYKQVGSSWNLVWSQTQQHPLQQHSELFVVVEPLWTNLAKRESSNCLHQILAKPSHHLEAKFHPPNYRRLRAKVKKIKVLLRRKGPGDFLKDLVLDSQVVRTWTQCTWPVSALLRSGMLTLCLAVETPRAAGWRSFQWLAKFEVFFREKGLQNTDEQEFSHIYVIL